MKTEAKILLSTSAFTLSIVFDLHFMAGITCRILYYYLCPFLSSSWALAFLALLGHASVLPFFSDFLHLSIKSSCTLWKESLNICHLLFFSLVSQGVSL